MSSDTTPPLPPRWDGWGRSSGAIAARTGDRPADVLPGVDQVMELLQVETTATVVVARVEQSDDERDRGVTHVRWSNAGHPPPMALTPTAPS